MSENNFKSGFVSIVGRPNVGKSTLMNRLVGEKLSIITSKAQTTRHRIQGIINGEDHQIVYSDTPGIIEPKYELQNAMMGYVDSALEDADVILFITDIFQTDFHPLLEAKLKSIHIPIVVIINKIDLLASKKDVLEQINFWRQTLGTDDIIPLSALKEENTQEVLPTILNHIPKHNPFYDEDTLTTRTERFFTAEIVREKIFTHYKKEVPYSTEVIVNRFKEDDKIIRIYADILVERKSQKSIIIGKGGEMIKKVGIEARQDMEAFFGKQIFIELFVKVEPDWRKKKSKLKHFGYDR